MRHDASMCARCVGNCCSLDAGITGGEAQELASKLSLDPGSFCIDEAEEGKLRLGLPDEAVPRIREHLESFGRAYTLRKKDNFCVFHENTQCLIYSDRPKTCRDYTTAKCGGIRELA